MSFLILAAAALAQASPTQELFPRQLLDQPKFYAIFDMYWRGRAALRVAGNRLCAATAQDKPQLTADYQSLDRRLRSVAEKLKTYHPNALNLPGTVMIGPPQTLCNDEKAAREAIGALEDVVVAAEYLARN